VRSRLRSKSNRISSTNPSHSDPTRSRGGEVRVESYSREILTALFVEFFDRGSEVGDIGHETISPGGGGRTADMSGSPFDDHIRAKHHLGYLDGFLSAVGCATVVVEADYVDRDFLDDFSAYHVRAFQPYRRYCTRLHFFSASFDQDVFTKLVVGETCRALPLAKLQKSYLGFVVIKPLPFTVMGRTCLTVYPDDGDSERRYPVASDQLVNLFGVPLTVKTLPFQEQDKDIAACATSALWSVFHATGKEFQHAIPSPVQITKAATVRAGFDERVLPNGKGLNSRQIVDAIHSVGLEPITVGLGGGKAADPVFGEDRTAMLKIATAAYLSAGIPCILLAKIGPKSGNGMGEPLGKHAMAIVGYRHEKGKPVPLAEKGGILFAATQMTRLYAHDDQVGPFARMQFLPQGYLNTAQVNDKGERFKTVADPAMMIVPLYHKIRIPYSQIAQFAIMVDRQINDVRTANPHPDTLKKRILWHLELLQLDDYRARVRAVKMPRTAKLKILTKPMPRFVWVLNASSQDGCNLFDLLLDPTDLLQGRLFLDAVAYDERTFTFVVNAIGIMDANIWKELALETFRIAMMRRMRLEVSKRKRSAP
jgi:hypothetical protein